MKDCLIVGTGCPIIHISNPYQVVDFIRFQHKTQSSIFTKIAPLYENGMSVSDISFQTGIARTTVWSTLKRHKFSTRKVESIPFDQWRRGRGKTGPRPPYGFSFFQGDVIKDPKEYPVLQLILNLWKQGTSISSIVRHLDGKRIKSRTGKPWSYNVVKAVVQRDPTQYQKLSKAKKREKK